MHRRSFVTASVLGATTTACSRTPHGTNDPDAPGDEFLARMAELDRGMEHLRCRPVDLGKIAKKTSAANDARVCREDPLDEQLYRSSLRALLLTASVKDLSEADRARPEVQSRLDAHAAEVDFAVHGIQQRLTHMSRDELDRVQRRLREDPELARRIVEHIDDSAGRADIPLGRRLRLRRLAKVALWRLRRQPTDLVIEECTSKLARLTERLGPIASAAPFARPSAESVAYWEAHTLKVVDRYQAANTPPPAAAPAPDATAEPGPADQQRAAADQQRAVADAAAAARDPRAAAEYQSAGDLYARAAALLSESDANRAARAELLDLSVAMYLQAYKQGGQTLPLRLALSALRVHDDAYVQAYGDARGNHPEYARIQSHTLHVQDLLERASPPPPAPYDEEQIDRAGRRRRVLIRGGIVLGVGVGLLALGLGLLFGVGLFLTGAILATLAGIAMLVGIIVMIVAAALR
ncbi:MAG: hypothetical protein JNL82_22230 [Myxococcales bacterium]|nr:hypothetical protein [Myxococcales bacterium]